MEQNELIQAVASGIADALEIDDDQTLLKILKTMSNDAIKGVAQVIQSTDISDDDKKQTIKQIVQTDMTKASKEMQKQQLQSAQFGAKLKYIQGLNKTR